MIQTGFIHDFARFKKVCEVDSRAIAALGAAVAGFAKPLVVTAGVALVASGRQAVETDAGPLVSDAYPRLSGQAAAAVAGQGAHVSVGWRRFLALREHQGATLLSKLADRHPCKTVIHRTGKPT